MPAAITWMDFSPVPPGTIGNSYAVRIGSVTRGVIVTHEVLQDEGGVSTRVKVAAERMIRAALAKGVPVAKLQVTVTRAHLR